MGSSPSERRVLVVHNPSTGLSQPRPEILMHAMRSLGRELIRRSLLDATVDEVLAEPSDLLVVAGGDGTVNRIARQLVRSDRLLSILPLGTANNIAIHLGFDLDPLRAIAQLGDVEERRLDVGVAMGPWGRRVFFEGAGFGLLAHAMPILTQHAHSHVFHDEEAKIAEVRRKLAELLDRYDAEPVRLELDGRSLERRCLMVEAMNVGAVGPRLGLAPAADTGDGLLDVVCLEEKDRAWLAAKLTGRAEGAPAFVRAREIRFEWTGGPIHVDDEVFDFPAGPGAKASELVTLSIEPGALRVLAPRRTTS